MKPFIIAPLFGLLIICIAPQSLAEQIDTSSMPLLPQQAAIRLPERAQLILQTCGAPKRTIKTDALAIQILEEISGTSGETCLCQAAQMELARLYESGEAVKQDSAIAYAYAFKAYGGFMPAHSTLMHEVIVEGSDDIAATRILTTPLSPEQAQQVKIILAEYRQKFSRDHTNADNSDIDITPKIREKYLIPAIARCHAPPTLRERLQFSLKICGVTDKLFKTDAEAVKALKLSADAPAKPDLCSWGLMDLALMYEAGEGVEQNAAIAYAYAYRANLGFMPPPVTPSKWGSVQERNEIAARRILITPLTPEQTQQVKIILRDYRQKFSRTPIDIDTIDITPQKR